jgi:hypothetical protein
LLSNFEAGRWNRFARNLALAATRPARVPFWNSPLGEFHIDLVTGGLESSEHD